MKIDILMATYNGEKYLKEQIDSILEQTYQDFRLLISDDMSTDSTRAILNEYVAKDNRVIVFLQNKNLGPVKNFEYLMKQVQSEYFMFSDQDDIWQKDKIQQSLHKMEETKSDLIYTNLQVVNEELEVIHPSYWKLKGFEKKAKKFHNFESLYLNNYITGCTMLVKSKWMDKILPLPQKSNYILHDYWTALIVSKFGRIDFIEQPMVKYRQHKGNRIGSKRKSDEIKEFQEIRDLFIDVKIDHFKIFMQNIDVFEDDATKKQTKEAYQYFTNLKKCKKINFKQIQLFWKLYQYENLKYQLENFLILNMPSLAKSLFQIRKGFKKG